MINQLQELYNSQSFTDSQNEDYENYLIKRKIISARMNSAMASFLFLIMTILDFWLIPSHVFTVFIVNSIAIMFLALTFYSTFHQNFIRYYETIIPITFIVPAFAIEYSMYLANPTDIAYFVLLSPLIISMLIMYSLSHLSLKMLILTTSLVIGGLVLATLVREESMTHGTLLIMVSNLFFVTSAVFVGAFGRIVRIYYYKENFLLQHSLTKVLSKKTKEVDKFEYFSNHDQLTGLSNRRYAEKNFARKLEIISELSNVTIVMFFLDLNGFKAINDNYGHDAGDEVLRVTATRLKECTPCGDSLVRLGGDEFLLCLTVDIDNNTIVDETKRKIQEYVTKPIHYKEHILTAGTSIGVARYPEDGKDLESLIKTSDEAMYKDKLSKKVMIPRKSEAQRQSA